MNIKNGFGKTQHFSPAPFFYDYDVYEEVVSSLNASLKTGLDKTTKDKFESIKKEEYEIIKTKIENRTYKFTRLKRITTKNNRIAYIPTIRDRIVIEYLKEKLERAYKPFYPNREFITKLIISKLNFGQEFYVFRYDIKKFFENIPHQILLKKIKESFLLTYHDYILLVRLLRLKKTKGLPTGLVLNNILSEIYLKDIDLEIKKVNSKINMYCRYVDDIIIMINGDLREKEKYLIDKSIEEIFRRYGLKLNQDEEKKQIVHINRKTDSNFNFLGYKYIYKKNILSICISDSKKEKLIMKINFIFNEYKINKNLELLIERLSYLTSINTMLKLKLTRYNKKRPLLIKHGAIENYKYIDFECWKYFDNIISKKIFQEVNIKALDRDTRKLIFKQSFSNNSKNKKKNEYHKFTNQDFKKLITTIEPSIKITKLRKLNRNQLEIKYKDILCL